MKRKTIHLLIALVFLFSLIPATVVGVGTAAAATTLNAHYYLFQTGGTGAAQWDFWDFTHDSVTESFSVNLSTTSAGDYAGVGMPGFGGEVIGGVTSLYMWYENQSGSFGPHMELLLHSGATQYVAVTGPAVYSAGWKYADALNGQVGTDWIAPGGSGDQFWYYGTWDGADLNTLLLLGGPVSFADVQTALYGSFVDFMGMVSGPVGGFSGDTAGTVYVDDMATNGVTFYGKIQNACDAASAGDTVYVWPGVYDEQVRIYKGITLQGAGVGAT